MQIVGSKIVHGRLRLVFRASSIMSKHSLVVDRDTFLVIFIVGVGIGCGRLTATSSAAVALGAEWQSRSS